MNSDCSKTTVSVCIGPRCVKNFSQYVLERAKAESYKNDSVFVQTCNCCGNCENGVSVRLDQKGKKRVESKVDPIKMANIIRNNK